MRPKSCSAYFFDFDGVLVDSTTIKTEAYRELFASHGPDAVSRIVVYHQRHGGISRVDKIIYAHKNFLNQPYSEDKAARDVASYSRLVFEKVIEANWINGAEEFVRNHYQKHPVFVISGTPENELKEIIKRRDMGHYFREILGSPRRKPEHIRFLLEKYNLKVENCVFIGDALTDYDAATETGMDFVGIQTEAEFPEGTIVLSDCTNLDIAVSRLKT